MVTLQEEEATDSELRQRIAILTEQAEGRKLRRLYWYLVTLMAR